MKYIVTLKRVQWEMKSVLQTAEYSLKHPVDNRNICKICFQTFQNNKSHNRHREVHMQSEFKITCGLCYCDFSWRKSLVRHLIYMGFTKMSFT